MDMREGISTVRLKLGLIPRLRVLFGAPIQVKIAHRGLVDKIVMFLGKDELGSVQ